MAVVDTQIRFPGVSKLRHFNQGQSGPPGLGLPWIIQNPSLQRQTAPLSVPVSSSEGSLLAPDLPGLQEAPYDPEAGRISNRSERSDVTDQLQQVLLD